MLIAMRQSSEGVVSAGAAIPAHNYARSGEPSWGTIYSGVKFDADGSIYARGTGGNWSRFGDWLLTGANTAYDVNRGALSGTPGTLTTDAGAGPLVLSTDRIYDIQNSEPDSTKTVSAEFTITLNGGSTVYATRTLTFSAEMETP